MELVDGISRWKEVSSRPSLVAHGNFNAHTYGRRCLKGRRRTFANAADRNTSHRFSQKSTCLEPSAGKKNADDKKVISTAEYLRATQETPSKYKRDQEPKDTAKHTQHTSETKDTAKHTQHTSETKGWQELPELATS
jgi:hypothetical protein